MTMKRKTEEKPSMQISERIQMKLIKNIFELELLKLITLFQR